MVSDGGSPCQQPPMHHIDRVVVWKVRASGLGDRLCPSRGGGVQGAGGWKRQALTSSYPAQQGGLPQGALDNNRYVHIILQPVSNLLVFKFPGILKIRGCKLRTGSFQINVNLVSIFGFNSELFSILWELLLRCLIISTYVYNIQHSTRFNRDISNIKYFFVQYAARS